MANTEFYKTKQLELVVDLSQAIEDLLPDLTRSGIDYMKFTDTQIDKCICENYIARHRIVDAEEFEIENTVKLYDGNCDNLLDEDVLWFCDIEQVKYDLLSDYHTLVRCKGEILATAAEGAVELIEYNNQQYIRLCDNTIITREEDLKDDPFFPSDL